MVSATACIRGVVAPSSGGVARSSGDASLRSGRSYDSLRSGLDIRGVRRSGARCRVGGVTLWASPGRPGRPRVAVIAGRSVGSAVRRNRAKRRIREVMDRIPLSGRDHVVVATAAVVEVPFEDLTEWIRAALNDVEDRRG